VVIIGYSGTGKSVALKHVVGLLQPDAGDVIVDGQVVSNLERDALMALRREIGFVFQFAALFDSMTVFDNVALGLRRRDLSDDEIAERVREALAVVDLTGAEQTYPAELSGGMRKRVGIARALVMEPEVVFFDEPTAGLDPTNGRLVAELIAELRTGVCNTAIVVTHDIEFADLVADRMAILHQGRFADVGSPAEIHRSANPDVRKFLAGELRAS